MLRSDDPAIREIAMKLLGAVARDRGCRTDDLSVGLLLAVEEAVLNAARHGFDLGDAHAHEADTIPAAADENEAPTAPPPSGWEQD